MADVEASCALRAPRFPAFVGAETEAASEEPPRATAGPFRLPPDTFVIAFAVSAGALLSPETFFGFGPGFPRVFETGAEAAFALDPAVEATARPLRGAAAAAVDFAPAADLGPADGRAAFDVFVLPAREALS